MAYSQYTAGIDAFAMATNSQPRLGQYFHDIYRGALLISVDQNATLAKPTSAQEKALTNMSSAGETTGATVLDKFGVELVKQALSHSFVGLRLSGGDLELAADNNWMTFDLEDAGTLILWRCLQPRRQ